jgi:hypothetical protein
MRTIPVLASLTLLVCLASAAQKSVAGTWMALAGDKPNPNMKLIFSPKGEFKFVGPNYSSSGTYTLSDNTIKLVWTKVDGQKVKPGTMKKTLSISPSNTLQIDRFTYAKVK